MAYFTMSFAQAVELRGGKIEFADDNPTGHTRIVGGGSGSINLERYEIFNEDYRQRLNGLIIDRFYNREIAHETIDIFRLALRRWLNENMPYWNAQYEAGLLKIDPLSTIDMKTVAKTTGDQTSTGNDTSNTATTTGATSRSVFSDLPQTMLAGNEDYASNATDSNSQSGVTGTGTNESEAVTESKTDSDSQTTGYQGHTVELLMAYRESVWNVDTMLLDSMDPLFMGVFMSADTQTVNNPQFSQYGRIYDAF